jgi:hypothetical protein
VCWPAIVKDLDGFILVYDPNNASSQNALKLWATWFCNKANLKPEQMICFAYTTSLNVDRQPLVIKNDSDVSISINVVNVNEQPTRNQTGGSNGPRSGDDDEADANATTAALSAFEAFINKCNAFVKKHPKK